MWLWLGDSLQLKKEDLLRHIWLCRTWNPIRKVVWYECWSLVLRSINLLATNRKSTFLSSEQKRNNEKDTKCLNIVYCLPLNNVQTSCWLYLETYSKRSKWKDESCWSTKTPLSQKCWRNMIVFKPNIFIANKHLQSINQKTNISCYSNILFV